MMQSGLRWKDYPERRVGSQALRRAAKLGLRKAVRSRDPALTGDLQSRPDPDQRR